MSDRSSQNSPKPVARVIENQYSWDTGAPLPHVISDSFHTYLAYILSDRFKPAQGQPVTTLNRNERSYDCALVHFDNCIDYRFGGVNDEVLAHHPLKGLDFYSLHMIHNSPWIAELQAINANHPAYNLQWWKDLKHFYFTFHDETFECIAEGYSVEVFHGFIRDVMALAFERMFS